MSVIMVVKSEKMKMKKSHPPYIFVFSSPPLLGVPADIFGNFITPPPSPPPSENWGGNYETFWFALSFFLCTMVMQLLDHVKNSPELSPETFLYSLRMETTK